MAVRRKSQEAAMEKEIERHPNVEARNLPQNFEAEQAALGSIMLDENAALLVMDGLSSQDFFSAAHREIFRAMYALASKDMPIDIVTLTQQLDEFGTKDLSGGAAYLSSLTNVVPTSGNFAHYAQIVKKNGMLRQLIDACGKISNHCFAGDDESLRFAEAQVFNLSEQLDKSTLKPIQPALNEAILKMEELYKDPKKLRGIPTPFSGLNYYLGGLQKSDLILIGARPGQGKTSIGMNMITHAALSTLRKTDSGKPNPFRCAVFSLEMSAAQIAKRLLCSVAKVSMSDANSGKLTLGDWNRLSLAKGRLSDAPIFIDDSGLTTPVEILSKCRRLKREQGLDLVLIDYLQLMTSEKRTENRQNEIATITRDLKIAAKELDVPIVLLSQLTREVEKRDGRKPQMSDLRESGAIEQDADIILFIYYENNPNDLLISEDERAKVQLVIAKHRNGKTGSVNVRWDGKTVSFVDIPRGEGSGGETDGAGGGETGGAGQAANEAAQTTSNPFSSMSEKEIIDTASDSELEDIGI